MPRVSRRPLDERARARLRDAQKAESDAVAAVQAASADKVGARAKLDAVIVKHHVAITGTDRALSKAQAQLVSVSGIERAALLLGEPVAALRAAVRSTTGAARDEPA
jgi:sigma54-dependent transcription regulator